MGHFSSFFHRIEHYESFFRPKMGFPNFTYFDYKEQKKIGNFSLVSQRGDFSVHQLYQKKIENFFLNCCFENFRFSQGWVFNNSTYKSSTKD